MLGRALRTPNELLRHERVEAAGALPAYYEGLIKALELNQKLARQATEREQTRQALYYNRHTRSMRKFKIGNLVWVYKPPRGQGKSKFVHQWMGPVEIICAAGYDNFCVERKDQEEREVQLLVHSSFLVSYCYPQDQLRVLAEDILDELDEEETFATDPIQGLSPSTQQLSEKPTSEAIYPRHGPENERDPTPTRLEDSASQPPQPRRVHFTDPSGPPSRRRQAVVARQKATESFASKQAASGRNDTGAPKPTSTRP